jgi:glycosyltransferase involved in cell wall biosynthesis
MEERFNNLKIAVVHDHLGWSGGGERTAMLIALELGADFITVYSAENTYADYQKRLGPRLKILTSRILDKEVIRFFWMRAIFWKNRKLFDNYDILIGSGQAATEAVAKYGRPDATRILYCHTPPRRVYDLYETSRARYKWFLRPLFTVFTRYWHLAYKHALDRFDYIVANSQNISDRLAHYTGHLANEIVWPPIMTEKFRWLSQGDYFLSWARVDEHKRVELIVEAFRRMPDKQLVVASGGSRLEAVKKLAENCPNIRIAGWQEEAALFELVGNCRAAIYIPIDEDAGMTHLEANAAGKPVIGVEEGGLRESIIEGETGVKIKADPDVDDLIAAVNKFTPEWCAAHRQICEQHAQKFDASVFVQKIKNIITLNDPGKPIIGIDASRWEDPRQPGRGSRTGVEVYVKNLLEKLVPLLAANGWRVRLYTQKLIDELPKESQKVIPAGRFWTMRKLAAELKHNPPDRFFTPAYYIPRTAPKKSYATVHDVIFKTEPKKYSFKERLEQGYTAKKNFARAEKIITVSDYSKEQIVAVCRQNPEKIVVASMGFDRVAKPFVSRKENLIVSIGRVEKKKSPEVLIKAFEFFCRNHTGWRLMLIGRPGFGFEKIKKLIDDSPNHGQIELLGYMEEEKKQGLLAEARIFVHPSDNEGSCLPLFEAWDCRTPAIIADNRLMRGLAGAAAIYFHPGDSDDLSRQMSRLVTETELSRELVRVGEANLEKMSWEKTAQQVLQVLIDQ